MKSSYKLLALMVAMTAGVASAASAGTTAGTAINNIATATFTDPSTNTSATPVNSNQVTTTVLPVTGFDVVYKDGSADGTTASTPAATYDKTNVLPGSNVDTSYTVVNNSNINNYVVNLTADTTGTSGTPTSVKYYLATDTTFSTPITSVTVPVGGQVDIVQRMVIPSTATPAQTFSASPHGNAPAGTVGTNAYAAVDESTNVNVPATPAANNDLEFTRATVFTPTLVNYPTPPVDPTNPNTPSTPGTTTVVPPTPANPGTPNSPVSPPGTPGAPSDPSVPGYTGTTPPGTPAGTPGTPIAVSGNSQIAYPPADSNSTPDTVIFNNVVATPVNAATPADTISLFPTNPTTVNNGNGTFTITTPTGPATVSFTDLAGNPLPTAVNPGDGKTYPVVSTPAGGGSAPYRTVVTSPDSNPNSNTTTTDNPVPLVITVGADSANDSDVTPNATTTDTVMPAAAAFGDVPASGTTADPTLIGPSGTAQKVVPGTAASAGAPSATTLTDSTAVFPMTINNTGEYNDTYTVTGSVPIKLADGTTKSVPVKYVDASGTELPKNTSGFDAKGNALPAFLADGVTPAVYYVTPLVPANSDYVAYATVDVPATAAATTGAAGLNPNPLAAQSATGNFSTIALTDINDQIQIGVIGGITVAKTQSAAGAAFSANPALAKPGDALSYKIIAKNTYNTVVSNFKLSDPSSGANNAFTVTNFVSANTILTGFAAGATAYYSVDGGTTFSSTAPAAGAALAQGIVIAVDTDSSGTITVADIVPAGAQIELDINTTVK